MELYATLRSAFQHWIHLHNKPRDQWGIVLALLIGLGGQIVVFLLPDPLPRLAPHLPMLAPQDWPGSSISTELFFSDPSASWAEKRSFFRSLALYPDPHTNAFVDQNVVWYAQTEVAAAAWDQLNTETYNGQSLVERNTDGEKPASMLFCLSEEPSPPRNCTYLAHWGHWYAEVRFWSEFDEDLPLPEMQRIGARVDQLLMSAPLEPCYGMFCTSEWGDQVR